MDLLNSLKANSKGGRTKKTYTLDEVCVILKLKGDGFNDKAIGEVLNRTPLTIGYKVRWIKGFDTIEAIFAKFNAKMTSEDDVMTRAEAFLDKLASDVEEAVA